VREWAKLRERNEALDLEVHALAALCIIGQRTVQALGDLAARIALPVAKEQSTTPTSAAPRWRPSPRGRWAGWRR